MKSKNISRQGIFQHEGIHITKSAAQPLFVIEETYGKKVACDNLALYSPAHYEKKLGKMIGNALASKQAL